MEHEMLLELALDRVDQLLVLGGAEGRDHQGLGLAAGEQRRAMGAGQHADFGQDRADGFGVAAVDPKASVKNVVADDVRLELLEQPFSGLGVQAFLDQFRLRGLLCGRNFLLADLLHGLGISGADIGTGELVDARGTTRGRGFTGVVRRWGFAGGVQTHGTHEYRRHGGSIGTNMTPGRTLPNLRMCGQYGNETVSIMNIKVARVDNDKHLLLLEGGVPGAKNGFVLVRDAIKHDAPKDAPYPAAFIEAAQG
jgi:ribosomal protein L3